MAALADLQSMPEKLAEHGNVRSAVDLTLREHMDIQAIPSVAAELSKAAAAKAAAEKAEAESKAEEEAAEKKAKEEAEKIAEAEAKTKEKEEAEKKNAADKDDPDFGWVPIEVLSHCSEEFGSPNDEMPMGSCARVLVVSCFKIEDVEDSSWSKIDQNEANFLGSMVETVMKGEGAGTGAVAFGTEEEATAASQTLEGSQLKGNHHLHRKVMLSSLLQRLEDLAQLQASSRARFVRYQEQLAGMDLGCAALRC